jgi:hypothetical protein
MDAAAHEEVGFDRHMARPHGLYEIVQDFVCNRLMERTLVPIAPEVEFEAFQFHAEFVGYVRDADCCEIRLTGLGTEAGEFRTIYLDIIIPARIRILKNLEFFGRLRCHEEGLYHPCLRFSSIMVTRMAPISVFLKLIGIGTKKKVIS